MLIFIQMVAVLINRDVKVYQMQMLTSPVHITELL